MIDNGDITDIAFNCRATGLVINDTGVVDILTGRVCLAVEVLDHDCVCVSQRSLDWAIRKCRPRLEAILG